MLQRRPTARSLTRRVGTFATTITLFATLLATQSSAAPLNVVLILVDDMGWTGLRCYGSDLHETPHIDRLAGSAVRFTNAYAAAPVCSPTRASIMTGKSPARLHMTVWYEASGEPPASMRRKLIPPTTTRNLPFDEITLAEMLRGAGYLTAHLGKWHLGDAAHYPENQGFDLNIGGTFWGCPATYFYPYRGLFGQARERRYIPGLPFGKPDEYLTDRLTDEAINVIDKAGSRPFFLNLCYYTVHTPIEGKPQLADYFAKKIRPGMAHDNANYAAMHKTLDDNVGRLLAHLDERGLSDRTLIILTSDNGGYINPWHGQRVTRNSPLRSGKGSLYEGGIRVPLIVRWPGVTPAGGVSAEPVITTDFYATLREILAVDDSVPHNQVTDGMSFVPLLRRPTASLHRPALYFHYPHYYPTTSPVSAIRVGPWKLLEYFEDGHLELYNLDSDLGEAHNLAESEPARAAQLRRQLATWRQQVGAQLPHPGP